MQASMEEKLSPVTDHDQFYSVAEISEEFYAHLKLTGHLQDDGDENDDVEEYEEEEEEDEEFSFNCGEVSTSPIAAEDAFVNGQIKPVFPLFNRDLSFSGEGLPAKPPVRKIFVETSGDDGQAMSSCGPRGDEIAGPCCEWSSRKAVQASPVEVCKKSNSTGFSKIWRFRELVGRCNSDGRDAFVFLNGGGGHAPPPPPQAERPAAEEKSAKSKRTVKRGGKRAAPLSAHGAYLKSKGKEEERRRSYLPYRPELMGFFTNVNGGLSKNVHHPF